MKLTECSKYYFDPIAAEKPIKFCEKYCIHFQGRFKNQPFLLHDDQKKIIRDVYGWKHRETNLRRFTDVYWEGAVGCGKSPTLAMLGLYGLMADGEAGAQVWSCSSSYVQSLAVFNTAKAFIKKCPALDDRLHRTQYQIEHAKSDSVWKLVSGKGPGAGANPSLVLMDEIHSMKSRQSYDDLQSRMGKRLQPLFWCATNTPESQNSLCGQLQEKALAALDGKGDETLYPVIWAAEPTARIDDPSAWRAANRLLGTTITEESVRAEFEKSAEDPILEARFRRLYLSQAVQQGGNKWIDLSQWDECTKDIDPEQIKAADLYLGYDGSERDDLCAATFTWVTPERFYVDAHFWIPRATAEHYERKNSIPYKAWADAGHITLIDEPTISDAVQARIAAEIVARAKPFKVKAVCFDRNRCGYTIAALEKAGFTCVDVAQGYTVTPGCETLDRRLKEKSITIAPNQVLRFNAENVEVCKPDRHGNYWPVKPGYKDSGNAGHRVSKIDGISALVTSWTEARKHSFPKKAAAVKAWTV